MAHTPISKRRALVWFIIILATYGAVSAILTLFVSASVATGIGLTVSLLLYFPIRKWKHSKDRSPNNETSRFKGSR
jgi:membrane protein implicated in regulation of membrane protease activity